MVEFSVDIGSDTEMSDPFFDGDEVFDPGDVYLWMGPPLLTPDGEDGFRDDEFAFGIDPMPDPPDPSPAVSAAPACAFIPPAKVIPEWFDLDGHDSVEFDLLDLGLDPDAPLPTPIPRYDDSCIHSVENLVLSYDDDTAAHYVGDPGDPFFFCQVPVTSTSPIILPDFETYGSTADQDEIIGLSVVQGLALPFSGASYPIADEETIHVSLAPNPPPTPVGPAPPQDDDDDVDSLDVVEEAADLCFNWLISVDHEATFGLDPGDIYNTAFGPPPFKIIDEVIHLGLPEDTDIDAFELVWTVAGDDGGEVLTLIFSVDDDDPLTPEDESGGPFFDPAVIYASYLTGFSFPLLVEPLEDDIDALAAWGWPLVANPCAGFLCGDANCDGVLDGADIDPFFLALGFPAVWEATYPGCSRICVADINGDATVDGADIDAFFVALGLGFCP